MVIGISIKFPGVRTRMRGTDVRYLYRAAATTAPVCRGACVIIIIIIQHYLLAQYSAVPYLHCAVQHNTVQFLWRLAPTV